MAVLEVFQCGKRPNEIQQCVDDGQIETCRTPREEPGKRDDHNGHAPDDIDRKNAVVGRRTSQRAYKSERNGEKQKEYCRRKHHRLPSKRLTRRFMSPCWTSSRPSFVSACTKT